MIAFGITAIRFALLIVLLAGTPLLLAFVASPQAAWPKRLSNAALISVGLVLIVALGLHIARVPITAASLAAAHLCIFAVSLVAALFRTRSTLHRPLSTLHAPHSTLHGLRGRGYGLDEVCCPLLTAYCLLTLLLLFPWTHFTGIDTYKWQDLATSVRMEQSLPWVVHPLSLFGFTPRAYPPAHPVLLATVQMVGGLGVDGGFAVVSWLVALLGVATATRLAGCFLPPHLALATGLLYVFSPVFMRYTHWATGRGLFLALFPALLALLIEPSDHHGGLVCSPSGRRSRYRRLPVIVLVAALLLLTHKVALVAVPLVMLAALAAGCLPVRRLPVAARIAMTLPFLLVAAAMVTPALLPGLAGIPGGVARTGIVRFGWMLPFALAGVWFAPVTGEPQSSRNAGRFLFLCALPALPLAFERQMYGALYALPFICLFAVLGFRVLSRRLPSVCRAWGVRVAMVLTLTGALVTVVARSRMACSPPLFRAAMFLEAYDPQGPFMIHAPGLARTRVQAYVSGCARFNVRVADSSHPQWPRIPSLWQGHLRTTVDALATALRGLVTLDDTDVDWYGRPQVYYYFVIDGHGEVPPDAERIYDDEGILIFLHNALP